MVSSWQNVVEIRLKYGLLQSTTIASDISRTWSSSTMGRRPTLGLGGLKRLNAVPRLSLAVRHQARPSTLLKTADFQIRHAFHICAVLNVFARNMAYGPTGTTPFPSSTVAKAHAPLITAMLEFTSQDSREAWCLCLVIECLEYRHRGHGVETKPTGVALEWYEWRRLFKLQSAFLFLPPPPSPRLCFCERLRESFRQGVQ
ncbi:hypothetical protein CSPX01_06575 [Colletotrichum filicis]|nr:hypothetical protein CSPX01_06575 [Colletotrichum filicis]